MYYYKIIGKNNFGNFPYKVGENTLASNGEVFNPELTCGPGGLHFCEIEHIFEWLYLGNKVCKLTVPSDAQMVKVKNKFKADKIFIESIRPVDIKMLISEGAQVNKYNGGICDSIKNGYVDLAKYLVMKDTPDKPFYYEGLALSCTILHSQVEILEFLIEQGYNVTDVHYLEIACRKGNLEIVKLLVKNGAPITSYAKEKARRHSEIAEYLENLK